MSKSFQLEEEDNVYDLVEEDQYVKLVEGRRSGSSFVVDDSKSIRYCMNPSQILLNQLRTTHVHFAIDGMGYYDDGEEHVGVADDGLDGQ